MPVIQSLFARRVAFLLLMLALISVSVTPMGRAEEGAVLPDEEEASPTPLNEFAPDNVQPARGARYDQGVTINRISIEGNKLIKAEQIRDKMLLRPGSLYSKSNLSQDLKRIYDMGYFTDNIKAVPVSTSKGIHLRIEVQENAPVTGVNIDGNTLVDDAELQEIFAGQTGLPQNIGQLNESIQKIEKLYADKGYILARVTGINDDPDGTINLHVNEGIIDKIEFVGNRKTKDYVVERAMAVKPGTVYNEKELSADLKRIYGTQAFSDVRRVITVSPDDPDKYNLTVEMDEKKTGAISLGGGLDTGTGFFGSAGYMDPNFLGRGQNFSSIATVGSGIIYRNSKTQASSRNYQFDVTWSDPSLFQSVNALDVNVYGRNFASFNVPLGVERRYGSEVAWSRPILSMKNTSFSLSLRGEKVTMRDFADSDELFDDFGINDDERKRQMKGGTFLTLSPTIAYDTRDNRLDPTQGMLLSGTIGGSYGLNGASYGTVGANVRKYFQLKKDVVFAVNGQAGSSIMGDIPEFNMYRLGGMYSVRGFNEGGLGIGNRYLMGSAEIRTKIPMFGKLKDVPVLNSLKAVAFLDAGKLYNEAELNSKFDRPGFGASTGLGLRVNIPGIGPLRVDYAIPLIGGGDYTQNFSFGVGQKF